MRFAVLSCLIGTVAVAQQTPSLVQFLGLTPAQVIQVKQTNAALDQFIADMQPRRGVLYSQISVENSKTSPDPLVLGQAYLEMDSIDRAISAKTASTQSVIAGLLTPRQMLLLQQVSDAIVQSSLVTDAGCAFLANNPLNAAPVFQGTAGISGSAFATFLLGGFVASPCPVTFPISIRNYLTLTDAEVAGILAFQSGYSSFVVQKTNRMADVQVELRDELAKPILEPIALGVRYIELAEITQEVTQANVTDIAKARALLNSSQQMKLQSLLDTSSLLLYQFPAITCRLISAPPGALFLTFYTPSGPSCTLN